MTDDFLGRLGRMSQELRRDIAELDTVIERAEDQRARYRAQLASYEQAIAVYRQVMDLPSPPKQQMPLVGTLMGSIPDMSAQIMEATGGPVTVRELVELLTAAGKFKNPGKSRGNYGTVFGMLRRDERFGKTPGKGEFYLKPTGVAD